MLLKGAVALSEKIHKLSAASPVEERHVNDPALIAVEPDRILREIYIRIRETLEAPNRKAGGMARAAALTPERRREIAKLANSKRKANQQKVES